jgi:hypothetical protein
MSAIAGSLSLTIDGATYNVAGQLTYRVSSTTRAVLKGQDGVHGYSEMPDEGYIEFTGRDSGAIGIGALNAATGATVVATLANGKVIIANNAWRDGEPATVNTEDGTFTVRFAARRVTEN